MFIYLDDFSLKESMKEENFLIFEEKETESFLLEQKKKVTFDKIETCVEMQLIKRDFEKNISDMFHLYKTCIKNQLRTSDTKKVNIL